MFARNCNLNDQIESLYMGGEMSLVWVDHLVKQSNGGGGAER